MTRTDKTKPHRTNQIKLILLFCLLIPFQSIYTQNEKEPVQTIRNIFAFTRVYGYIRYFYPGYESEITDWDKFAFYGLNKIKSCKSDKLVDSLNNLFIKIVPSIKIYIGKSILSNTIKYTPTDTLMFWQYKGLKSSDKSYFDFLNKKVSLTNNMLIDSVLFQQIPESTEFYKAKIEKSIYLEFPLVVLKKDYHNASYKQELKDFAKKINTYRTDSISAQNKMLSELVVFWNIIQHFYPYHQESKLDWENTLNKVTEHILQYQPKEYSDQFLFELGVASKDGHFRALTGNYPQFYLPAQTQLVENKAIVIQSFDTLALSVGDIIKSINGVESKDLMEKIENLISGSDQLRKYYSGASFHASSKADTAIVELIRNNQIKFEKIKRVITVDFLEKSKKIDSDVYYFNLIGETNIDTLISIAQKYRNIILDWRGGNPYFIPVHQLFQHLVQDSIPSPFLFTTPEIINPDGKNIFKITKQKFYYKPVAPYFKCNLVILSSAWNISYDESIIKLVQYNKLGTIIGERTAGTDGSINYTGLPTKTIVGWTGVKCQNLDGSQHHLIGIVPDIEVKPTIEGVMAGKDEVLEYAVEYIKKQ